MTGPDLAEVQLLGLPVPLWARAQEQTDGLIREFTLIAEEQRHGGAHGVPARLTRLVEELTSEYGSFGGDQEAALAEADAKGTPTLDLVYRIPAAVADAARHLGSMLDEADEYCRAGAHLLTLAATADVVRFRRWFLEQFVDQLAGRPAVAWADWPASL